MSVATHLGIRLPEYDRRIRSFVPFYRESIRVVAGVVQASLGPAPRITDLGIGTGALSSECLALMPRASVYGVDTDAGILDAARRRLARHGARVRLAHGSFTRMPLPRSDAFIATLALHHIRSAEGKQRFYQRCRQLLLRNGILVTGDVFLADDPARVPGELAVWHRHMQRSYSPRKTAEYLAAWSHEDRYFPIGREMGFLRAAGFDVEVVWRRAPFAVLLGRKR